MKVAVLQHRPPDKPALPLGNIRLAVREGPIETVRHEVLRAAKGHVLTVDDGQGQAGPGTLRPLHQKRIHHPKPESVSLDGVLRWQADRQDADLFDCGYVLKRVPVEAPSGRPGRERWPALSEIRLLRVEGYTLARNQLATLDLYATGLAA